MRFLWLALPLAMLSCAKEAPVPVVAPQPTAAVPADEPAQYYEPMPEARPGDWLHRFPEEGQTFEEYVRDCANRKDDRRKIVYLQPMGRLDENLRATIERMREYCEIYFGTPCVVREAVDLPENCLILPRRQYNATMLIGHLQEMLPDDALVLAGVTDQDLFSRGLNFVFGEGSLRERCGVYSLRRLGGEPAVFLERSLKLLTHEAGHILSIQHCIRWKCTMSGANSLEEGDRYPLHPCPEDLRKLEWNLGFDRMERFRKLGAYYRKHGLEGAAAWVDRRLKAGN